MRRLIVALLAALVTQSAFAIPPFGGARVGFWPGPSSGTGFLPAGHFVDAKQAMIDVFPRPDSETSAVAREHQAYIGEEYDIAIGVSFGAYPYVCTLLAGPPGMSVASSVYTTFQNKNYCRVTWTPTTSYNGEAEVQVEDQQHNTIDVSWAVWTVGAYTTSTFSGTATVNGTNTLSVSGTCTGSITPGMVMTGTDIPTGDYIAFELTGTGCDGNYQLASAATGSAGPESVTGSYEGGAIFVSPSGSGTTCTAAAPCTLTTAFGSTFAASSFPGAIAYASTGTYTGAYNLPQYSDTVIFGSTGLMFEVSTTNKPAALIGIPGDTITIDGDVPGGTQYGSYLVLLGNQANDWYMENIQFNGYDSSYIDHGFGIEGSADNRMTFDQVVWNNSGYGTGTSNNMSMFVSSGTGTPRQYLFITDSAENNRESGSVGNNYAFMDLYSEADALIQRNTEDSPSASFDSVFYAKSDIQNTDIRENLSDVSGGGYGFSTGQNQYALTTNVQFDYNMGRVSWQRLPGGSTYTWGPEWSFRNSFIATSALQSADPNANIEGPTQATPTASGSGTSLLAGGYTVQITSLGVTGESAPIAGTEGNGNTVAGSGNGQSITITAGQQINISWTAEYGAPGYNVYVMLSPPSAPTLGSSAGGTLAATTYYVKETYVNATGETGGPNAANLPVAANSVLTVSSPPASGGATGYNVYVCQNSGSACTNEELQNASPISIGTGWTEPTTGLITGVTTPTTNTTAQQFSAGSATSFTYTGQAGTVATPPSTSTAVSTARFDWESNAVQTPGALPSGATITTSANTLLSSGLLDTTTFDLTGTYANPPSGGGILGTVGAQISATQ